uniref:Small ribosomal subunit protein bS6 n=1 Tax=candidate division WOR-3 bacterium TaxID=2052148 RepID=A0A7V4E2X5_UNCW3
MRDYEMMMILDAEIPEEGKKKVLEKIENMIKERNGKINELIDWGIRKFAYPIRKKEEGHYFILKFSSPPGTPSEIKKEIRLVNEIYRVMIIREDNVKRVKKRRK